MQRLKDDRGGVAVIVALLIVPLVAFAAIAVDVAAMWADKQQLQTGADAGALAIAQDCARGACGNKQATAQALAEGNKNDERAWAAAAVTTGSKQVTVTTTGVRKHWFAPVLGLLDQGADVDRSTMTAQATAAWGYPAGGTSVLPLIFSLCDFRAQTNGGMPSGTTPYTIRFSKSSDTQCTGPSGNLVPGGFGWIKTSGGKCQATTRMWDPAYEEPTLSDPGSSPSNPCQPADFQAWQGRTVLLPLFDHYGGNGNNAWYRVHGYAAFTITGYYFAGGYSWNNPCSGSDRCISGYFTRYAELSDAWTRSDTAPNLGASVVSLID